MLNLNRQLTNPNHSCVFAFESAFVHEDVQAWLRRNWTAAFYCIGVYLLLIFGGQYLMKNRKPFRLRGALSLWSASLSVFATIGAIRTAPELITILTHHGLYDSVCTYMEQDRVAGFWTWIFVLSKLPELGDTIFIVLRKQPLTFLHCYHHISVLLYCWFSYKETTASTRWYVVMNYSVHSIMYAYYAVKAKGFRLPRQMAVFITSLQLVQMTVGCVVNLWLLKIIAEQRQCTVSHVNVNFALAMYFSYLVLFGNFFYGSYLSGRTKLEYTKSKIN